MLLTVCVGVRVSKRWVCILPGTVWPHSLKSTQEWLGPSVPGGHVPYVCVRRGTAGLGARARGPLSPARVVSQRLWGSGAANSPRWEAPGGAHTSADPSSRGTTQWARPEPPLTPAKH